MDDTASSAAVTLAALVVERVRCDGARTMYAFLRERYVLALLARERQRVLWRSHEQTLAALQGCGTSACEMADVETKRCATQHVPDTVVAAVGLLFLTAHPTDKTGDRLNSLLQCGVSAMRQSSVSTQGSVATTSSSSAPALRLGPLLYWSRAGLSYTSALLPERRRHAAAVARARCAATLQQSAVATTSAPVDGVAVSMASSPEQKLLADARAALKRAKDFQRCVKQRLYETHRRLTAESLPSEAAAAELYAQVRRELRSGRVTLLRILCEKDVPPPSPL